MNSSFRRALAIVATAAVLALGALPASSAEPAVQSGDLTHLVYTATEGLTANLLAPLAGSVVPADHAKVDVVTVIGAGVELAVNGAIVAPAQIGERIEDADKHTARYTYYAVPFSAGANDVAVTSLGANGARGETKHVTLVGAGKPVAVTASIDGALVADGRSAATLTVTAQDVRHNPAQSASLVRVSVLSGDASVATINDKPNQTSRSAESGLNEQGATTFRIVAGTQSGNVVIAIAAGDARAKASTFVAPFLRRAFVTGLVSGGFGSTPGDRDDDGNADNGGSRRGRAAVYANGQVLPGTQLALAYDTASRLAPTTTNGPYVLNPAERPYATYGDASTRTDDAVSDTRLYARLDNGRNSYTYGRFNADIGGETSASSYQQVLSGSRLELANKNDTVHAVAFSADNNIAYARESLPVTGLATLGQTLNANIVVGSDLITLVTTDRRTGAVVLQTPLVRNVDYVLDNATGVLRFLQIPLPFDSNGNPQFVVVQYQYTGVTTNAKTTGGKISAKIGAATVRAGYVNDVSGSGNFALFEQGITAPLAGGGWSLTHANASGIEIGGSTNAASSGQSTRFALATVVGGTRVQLGYDVTSAGFQNPFGGFATPGLTDYLVSATRAFGPTAELSFNANGQRNSGIGTNDAQAQQTIKYKKRIGSRLTVAAGLDAVQQTAAGNAIQAQATAAYRIGEKSTFSIGRIEHLGGSASSSQPAQTTAGIDYAIDRNTHAFVRETWLDTPQSAFAESGAPVTGTQGGTRLLAFGVDRKVGPSTTVTSQYTVDHTIDGASLYATSGVREALAFGPHFKGDAFLQTSRVTTTSTSTEADGYTAYGVSMAYSSDRFHATSAFQNRAGALGGYGLQLGAAGALNADLSLVGTLDQSTAGGIRTSNARAGLALRPHDDDRGASLLEFDRSTNNISTGTETTNTVAFEEAYRPTNGLELNARFAYKLDGDGFYAAHSTLLDLRADQRVGSHADIAVETRTLRTAGIAGATTTALAIENGWRLGNAIRLAAGYNFSAAADPSLAVDPSRKGFYVTMTSVVSRIFGWGK